MAVHPTAIIERGATVHSSCMVGPFCVIGQNVTLGAENRLLSHVVISGITSVGIGNIFLPFTSIGMPRQGKEADMLGVILIGKYNVFREGVTIQGSSADQATSISDRNLLFANAHIAHGCILHSDTVINNCTNLAGRVVVHDGAQISANVGIHQHVHVGSRSFIAAGSMVDRNILPFAMAEGNRVRIRSYNKTGLERTNFLPEEKASIKAIIRSFIYRGRSGLQDALLNMPINADIVHRFEQITRSNMRALAPGRS